MQDVCWWSWSHRDSKVCCRDEIQIGALGLETKKPWYFLLVLRVEIVVHVLFFVRYRRSKILFLGWDGCCQIEEIESFKQFGRLWMESYQSVPKNCWPVNGFLISCYHWVWCFCLAFLHRVIDIFCLCRLAFSELYICSSVWLKKNYELRIPDLLVVKKFYVNFFYRN